MFQLEDNKVYVITRPEDTTVHLICAKQKKNRWMAVHETRAGEMPSVEMLSASEVTGMVEAELERVKKEAEDDLGNKG